MSVFASRMQSPGGQALVCFVHCSVPSTQDVSWHIVGAPQVFVDWRKEPYGFGVGILFSFLVT